ncbi:selenoprotein W-related protein [Anaerosolibacter carboniphilus]|uniref:Selenoprotein W-related protein n=1 Tax=Anaerosolibacter carboniphilus TaxID=1417629 RepID=A0A841KWG6_9FIRM|nr:selenoprotein W-related protein [Anaerosolibacter carboniphilus]
MAENLLHIHKNSIASLNIIPSSGGVFEVMVDDNLVFSKKDLGRFPEENEVENKIKK